MLAVKSSQICQHQFGRPVNVARVVPVVRQRMLMIQVARSENSRDQLTERSVREMSDGQRHHRVARELFSNSGEGFFLVSTPSRLPTGGGPGCPRAAA